MGSRSSWVVKHTEGLLANGEVVQAAYRADPGALPMNAVLGTMSGCGAPNDGLAGRIPPKGNFALVVTNSRLLVTTRRLAGKWSVLAEFDPSDIASASFERKRLANGKLHLTFTDSSVEILDIPDDKDGPEVADAIENLKPRD